MHATGPFSLEMYLLWTAQNKKKSAKFFPKQRKKNTKDNLEIVWIGILIYVSMWL